ncbi:hypothetical protein LOTGIDRAFT_170576 [Lottia gigantea]|uniref:Uncharacterized protein n=1 Tax=Lottia gigantea TaxID=225164 RepID=V4BFT2_LOTGI|nr:hypothetical protein LOTGIDRAFT_170576 [Lottia gigantea]ESP04742.1 hypothetical protein LOTGIDRAFT_170576 [Lottia gigantea]
MLKSTSKRRSYDDLSSQDDPCNSYRMLYDDGGRSINCSLYYSESSDRFIDEGWRRVQLESTGEDLTMPTECVPRGFCGSHNNVWLNGTRPTVEDGIVDRMGWLSTHPTVEDGIVDRMGCLSNHPIVEDGIVDRMGCLSNHPTVEDGIVDRMGCLSNHPTVEDGIVDRIGCLSMFSSCCKVKYPIQIKNCTDYMVYNLKRLLGSDQRYCFGDSTHCYQTTRSTSVSPFTNTSHPTTVSSTTTQKLMTKTPRQTQKTLHTSSKTSQPTTVSSTTKKTEVRPVQMDPEIPSSVDNNRQDNLQTTNVYVKNELVSNIQYHEKDDMIMILRVSLSVTIALLIILVLGILFMRHRTMTKDRSKGSSEATNQGYDSEGETNVENTYDTISPPSDVHGHQASGIYLTVI